MSLINKSFINKYKKEGFCFGIPIFSKGEIKSIRSEIETLEKKLIILSKNNFTISYNIYY